MTLIGIVLKLIEFLALTESSEYKQLYADAKAWENSATKDSENKLQQMYAKLHDGIWFKLCAPFLYFAALKETKKIMSDDVPDLIE